jgi:hypothetical protein
MKRRMRMRMRMRRMKKMCWWILDRYPSLTLIEKRELEKGNGRTEKGAYLYWFQDHKEMK